ncbi:MULTISPECIES: STAS domain-containing protein [Streptomyces]|uniref:Anti-sigma factor antagonist n=2 Tax=Streptomyces TaxID=1883 RepID=A0A100YAL6_9ACTN|nr:MULTISPECIES: STAS domain-containing protein [Streptomyces]KUH40586.1 anti-anti-sigma factor [Streptomyces kanasensis]UUS33632.1 STAS domain-containing protein [Streptomyces changanensis]
MKDTDEAVRPGPLSIRTDCVDGIRVVTVHGEIDHTSRDTLHRALTPAPDGGRPRTVIDLGGVSFMDSSGVNVLIAAHQSATGADGWLRLADPQESVLRLVRLVGLDTVIPCHPTLQQALRG